MWWVHLVLYSLVLVGRLERIAAKAKEVRAGFLRLPSPPLLPLSSPSQPPLSPHLGLGASQPTTHDAAKSANSAAATAPTGPPAQQYLILRFVSPSKFAVST